MWTARLGLLGVSKVSLATLMLALPLTGCGGPGAGGTGGSGVTLEVSEDVTAATTWSTTLSDCDVVIEGVVDVKAALTIQPGAKVCFGQDSGLLVTAAGSLKAVGSADARIAFTGASPTPGFWKGIAFVSNNVDNQLHFVDIEYAGGADPFCCGFFIGNENAKGAVVVGDLDDSARVSVQNSRIARSGAYGIFAMKNASLQGFANNRFEANVLAPVSVPLSQVDLLDSGSVYSGEVAPNGRNVARVLDLVALASPVRMRRLDVPYSMGEGFPDSVFDLGAELTIEGGARLEFEANSGLLVKSNGRLTALGAPGSRITLTGRSATPGFWKGIALLSLANSLTETDLTHAGNDDAFCCGFFEPGSGPSTRAGLVVGDYNTSAGATITNVNVTQSKNRGVSVLKGTLTQAGVNDLSTGNLQPNLGI